MNPEILLEEANRWQAKAEAHRKAMEYCEEQARRFMGRIAVPDEYRAELRLVDRQDV